MINAASSNPLSPDTINIAAGTYKPDASVRGVSFQITNKNVILRGGGTVPSCRGPCDE